MKCGTSRLALVVLLLVGCKEEAAPDRGPVTPLDESTAGTVTGIVRFEGEPPAPGKIRMTGDAACTGEKSGEDVLVKEGRVQNAFVWIEEGLGDRVFALPKDPVVVDQQGCLFVPHVAAAESGQEIVFKNSDSTLHNVHTTPKNNRAVNFGLGVKNATRATRLSKSEVMVPVKCDVHPWMRAYIGVVDHPYFAVTRADGTFRLEKVPPGEYTLAAWHERFGERRSKVTVTEKGTVDVPVVYGGTG